MIAKRRTRAVALGLGDRVRMRWPGHVLHRATGVVFQFLDSGRLGIRWDWQGTHIYAEASARRLVKGR